MSKKEKIKIFIDGGARGNPGPSALGVIIKDQKGSTIKKYSQFLGTETNNIAEYSALIFAFKKIKLIFGKVKIKELEIEVFSDSQLLVEQLKGRYKILDPEIQKLFLEVWNLKVELPVSGIKHISREENKEADYLVNQELDSQQKTLI
jgi:ribonuclease HI